MVSTSVAPLYRTWKVQEFHFKKMFFTFMCAHVQECHCASVAVSEHVLSFHHVGSETELGFSGLVPLYTEASRQFKGFL